MSLDVSMSNGKDAIDYKKWMAVGGLHYDENISVSAMRPCTIYYQIDSLSARSHSFSVPLN